MALMATAREPSFLTPIRTLPIFLPGAVMKTTALIMTCVTSCVMSSFVAVATSASEPSPNALQALNQQAQALDRVHAIVVAYEGNIIHEHHQGGPGVATPANVKSLSKTVLAAVTGAAIEAGIVESVDQPLVALLDSVPSGADPQVNNISVAHLLAQQAGLERTSGSNYGAWVASAHWVNDALTRPFVDHPGGRMLYSTGTSHLLSGR